MQRWSLGDFHEALRVHQSGDLKLEPMRENGRFH
jgi:hypothetical protein